MTPSTGSTQAPQAAYPTDLQERVDDYLAQLEFASEPGTRGLDEAMRYSLLAPAKRIRPLLALATARAIGLGEERVLPLAAAIELIHTYSLIHDDLPAMDDDDLRRGRPTCHVEYGDDVAILAGDGLFAEAINLVIERQQGPATAVLAAVRELARAAGVGGMVGGQYLDVKEAGDPDAAGVRHLHELKTGRLIAASVECVVLIGEIPERARIPYGEFARELGVLFQIVDDILDVVGDERSLGKPRGSDERHGKRTYVSVFGLERARGLAEESHRNAKAALARADGDTATLERIGDYILTRQS